MVENRSKLRLVRIAGFVAALVAAGSWVATALVQGIAFELPSSPVGLYIYPQNIKGNLRYLTAWQSYLSTIGPIVFQGAIVAGIALGILYQRIEERIKRQDRPPYR